MIISEFCSGFCDQRWQETNNCCNRQIENRIDGENHKQNWCRKLQTVATCKRIWCCKLWGDSLLQARWLNECLWKLIITRHYTRLSRLDTRLSRLYQNQNSWIKWREVCFFFLNRMKAWVILVWFAWISLDLASSALTLW